ncbi:MAG: MotA/TolQ/ExbB proton channel family protein [Planctomycetota bacterium]|nr:MotA/TolQ/ExbB proton channel family protein [Planctomycetota bacterium]
MIGQTGGARQMGIDFFDLLIRGGIFMIPIGLTSLLVVTFAFDRWIGLRRGKLMPSRTLKSLRGGLKLDALDPVALYGQCRGDSALGQVVQAALLRAGRPYGEIQAAVGETVQRQVDRAYANVRWLNLGAGIAPLLGLLGTVWGLIRAFHDTTKLTAGQNRADFLAVGIYEALVTTLAGLMVAIPAAVASHYFEGRIGRIFRDIEEQVGELVRRLGGLEGKIRTELVGQELKTRPISNSVSPAAAGSVTRIPPPIPADGSDR